MSRATTTGAMVGCMVGIVFAVGAHTLLTAHPELASTWLGLLLAKLSAPGSHLIGWLGYRTGAVGVTLLSQWLSLQLTLVLGGAITGAFAGFFLERFRTAPSEDTPAG